MPTLIGILYFFHLFQNYLLKVVRKITNMFLSQPPPLYTADNPLFWDSSFFFFSSDTELQNIASVFPLSPPCRFFLFVCYLSSRCLQCLMFCLQLSVSPLSPLANINYQPKQSFQVISAPVFLLMSNALLVIYLILNCKITFQKTTILDHKHSIHPLIFLFKVPHWSIWQFM